MIFQTLWESAQHNELMLVDGGMCRWHLRKDGQITIREIIVLPQKQRQGIGTRMLGQLKRVPLAASIFAKCPADLEANGWYARMGFALESVQKTRTKKINLWRLHLSPHGG